MDSKKAYFSHSSERRTQGENLDIEWRENQHGHVLDILLCSESARHECKGCTSNKAFDKL